MHRNTYLLITLLAVVAALVVGVNLGSRVATLNQPRQVPTTAASPKPNPAQTTKQYTNAICGVSFLYPDGLTALEDASGSAIFINATDNKQAVAVTCQKDIPRPPLPPEKIESRILTNALGTATVAASLYHDASAKDGTPVDSLIFRHPTIGLDVYIAGFGSAYNELIATIKLLP